MKGRKKCLLLLGAWSLILSLLLSGCSLPYAVGQMADDFLSPEGLFPSLQFPAEHTPGAQEAEPYLSYEDYMRPETPFFEPIPFEEIEYRRPDGEGLCFALEQVQMLVESGAGTEQILDAYEQVYEDYVLFDTMSSYAYIRYTLDLSDPYFDEEQNWCAEQEPLVEQALERCFVAMAESDLREELEEAYFGADFFAFYDEFRIYSNDAVVALLQEEAALQTDYMALQNEITLVWQGEERLMEELLEEEDLSYEELLEIYGCYYETYGPQATEIFIRLVEVRQQIAALLGYESYAHFAYAYYYERDYSPEDGAAYTAAIASGLSQYYATALFTQSAISQDMDWVMEHAEQTIYAFGGELATAYTYMQAYGLSDLSRSPSKMPGSYMTYLSAYDMPYLYVSPQGDMGDFLTVMHEFGHFTDGFVNCNGTSSIDCAEVFSQGLEFLSLNRVELSRWEQELLVEEKVADALMTYLTQACYAAFEERVYALDPEELSVERLNEIFWECNVEFGTDAFMEKSVLAPGWIDIQHFFIAPYYVISYCVSNDVALQIYERELETGEGLALYRNLLSESPGSSILELVEAGGLEDPFSMERARARETFFRDHYDD